jgi:hypothetical protein
VSKKNALQAFNFERSIFLYDLDNQGRGVGEWELATGDRWQGLVKARGQVVSSSVVRFDSCLQNHKRKIGHKTHKTHKSLKMFFAPFVPFCGEKILCCNSSSPVVVKEDVASPMLLWLETACRSEPIFGGSGKLQLAESSSGKHPTIVAALQPSPFRKVALAC